MATETKNKGNPKEAGGSTTKQEAFPMVSSHLLNMLTPEVSQGLQKMFPNKRINDDDLKAYLTRRGRQSKPKLMKPVPIPDESVKKGEKPNMGQVAGGFKTLNVAKGGMVRKKKTAKKKTAKKSKFAGRAAKRGYGMAKRGK
tara:strand:- start:195 stop:620 length:426 start_codon:yes stop_codon:yes gene_type:complete